MRHLLWPDSSPEEHLRELELGLRAVNFVALDARDELIGFLETGLRSHADGCDPAWLRDCRFSSRFRSGLLERVRELQHTELVTMASDNLQSNR